MGDLIDLLPDGADGEYCFLGTRGIIESDNIVIRRKFPIAADQKIQQSICMGIVGDKDTLFLSLILFFQDRKDFLEGALVFLIMLAQVPEKNFTGKLVVPAEIFKAPDPAIGGNGFRRGGIDVDQHIAAALQSQNIGKNGRNGKHDYRK